MAMNSMPTGFLQARFRANIVEFIDSRVTSSDFLGDVRATSTVVIRGKVNLALDGAAEFKCLRASVAHLRGAICQFRPGSEVQERASDDAKYGTFPPPVQ